MSSIVLIGFMGAGKTTVGKELVKKGFELIDTDAYIEAVSYTHLIQVFSQLEIQYVLLRWVIWHLTEFQHSHQSILPECVRWIQ